HEVGLQARLLAELSQDGLVRELALVDVAAGRQPQPQLLVLEQEDLALAHRVAGDHEAVALHECEESNLRRTATRFISCAAAGFSLRTNWKSSEISAKSKVGSAA